MSDSDYRLKAKKYKQKYLNLKKQYGGYKGDNLAERQPINTEGYKIKFFKGHGIILSGEPFLLKEGYNVITLTENNINLSTLVEYDKVIDRYLKNYYIFENENTSPIKTREGQELEDALNRLTQKAMTDLVDVLDDEQMDIINRTVINIRNHVGPIPMNEMMLNVSQRPCDDKSRPNLCGIDGYNYKGESFKIGIDLRWLDRHPKGMPKHRPSFSLSDLIEKEGPGTYIIRSCRKLDRQGLDEESISKVTLTRQTSAEADIRRELALKERQTRALLDLQSHDDAQFTPKLLSTTSSVGKAASAEAPEAVDLEILSSSSEPILSDLHVGTFGKKSGP